MCTYSALYHVESGLAQLPKEPSMIAVDVIGPQRAPYQLHDLSE